MVLVKQAHRNVPLIAAGLASMWVVACEKPGAAERQKEERANQEAVIAKGEAERQAQAADEAAQRSIAAARSDFAKAREEYLHGRRLELLALDDRVFALESNARIATGNVKTELEGRAAAIRAEREVFERHLRAMESTSVAAWDAAKANLDKEWDELKATVDRPKK
jgi:hypothetical protein